MSLFANFAAQSGDIWSLSGIVFTSPVNDLLDSDDFTLEQLLEEADLLQEVKSKNHRLIEYLATFETLDKLLNFIIYPASQPVQSEYIGIITPQEMITFKYPYVSCEILCCEVPEILTLLVEQYNGELLDKLFSFLTVSNGPDYQEETTTPVFIDGQCSSPKPKLDCYLSGYFEKILEMLFRRMTVQMMRYFNDAGLPLFKRFLFHIDNYSIMQIVQRLMLPHIPFSNAPELDNIPYDEIREHYQCNWSYNFESCKLLFDKMFDVSAHAESSSADIPLHVSDLLITVLQLSPPETLVIKFLCESACINKLLFFACWDGKGDLAHTSPASFSHTPPLTSPHASSNVVCAPTELEIFSPMGNISLSAISVLESLISRLFESSLPLERLEPHTSDSDPQQQDPQQQQQQTPSAIDFEAENAHIAHIKEVIELICMEIVPYIPQVDSILRDLVSCESPAGSRIIVNQSKRRASRLGHRGLQLVKFVESIVRVGVAEIDQALCQYNVVRTCLDLFFKYDTNSLLHLSVQRILINIIEGDLHSREMQLDVIAKCDLLRVVRLKLYEYEVTESPDYNNNSNNNNKQIDETVTVSHNHDEETVMISNNPIKRDSRTYLPLFQRDRMGPKHSSMMGSMVLVAQALAAVMDPASNNADSNALNISGGSNPYNLTPLQQQQQVQHRSSPNFLLLGTAGHEVYNLQDYDDDVFAEADVINTSRVSNSSNTSTSSSDSSPSLGDSPPRFSSSPLPPAATSEGTVSGLVSGLVSGHSPPPSPPTTPQAVSKELFLPPSLPIEKVSSNANDGYMEFDDEDEDPTHHPHHHLTYNQNSLRAAILSHTTTGTANANDSTSINSPTSNSLQVLNEWDTFVDIQLRTVLNHQLIGTYQSSAAAAIAAANGLGATLFSNYDEDLITAGIDNFKDDDYLHLGLSFDETGGSEHPEDVDDDGQQQQHPYRDRLVLEYQQQQLHLQQHQHTHHLQQQTLDVKSSGGRSIQRNKSVNFDGDNDTDNNNAFKSYRDTYNFNKTVILNNTKSNSNEKEEAFDDNLLETINFAAFANFDNLNDCANNNSTSSEKGREISDSSSAWKDTTMDDSDGDWVSEKNNSAGSSNDLFADFDEVDFSASFSNLELGTAESVDVVKVVKDEF